MDTSKSYIKGVTNRVRFLFGGTSEDFRSLNDNIESNFCSFYTATNENLSYFASLNVEDKDALTVTGSGDQALNLAYFGAKSIETFDINQMALISFDLKKTAILHLTRSEYIDFYTSPNFLDRKIYKKIYPFLNPLTKAVFDTIFANVKQNIDFTDCIEEFCDINTNFKENNPYLSSEQAYRETQKRLKALDTPITSKGCSITEIAKNFDRKDVIILSNVLRFCIDRKYDDDYFNFNKDSDVNKFMRSIAKMLKRDGIVSLVYIFGYWCDWDGNDFDQDTLRKFFRVKGDVIEVDNKVYGRKDHVFVAEKEDFPWFERF